MPSQHKHPAAIYRPDPELLARAKTATDQVGSNMNVHITAFLRWLVGDTDDLPARPAPPDPAGRLPDSAEPGK